MTKKLSFDEAKALAKRTQERHTVIKSKFKGNCSTCHYTIWQGERIAYNGKPHHIDCKRALNDDTPRTLDPYYQRLIGKVSKKRLRKALG